MSSPSPEAAPAPQLPHGAVLVPPVANQHAMVTCDKLGFRQPALYHSVLLFPVPRRYCAALVDADPNWRATMEDKFSSFLENNTWDLVPHPPTANLVTGKWIFKHKFKADGSLEHYKA